MNKMNRNSYWLYEIPAFSSSSFPSVLAYGEDAYLDKQTVYYRSLLRGLKIYDDIDGAKETRI